MSTGYRLYRKTETTAAEHDLQTLRNNVKRARRQAAEFRGYALDTNRTEENRAACLAMAAGCDMAAVYLEERIAEQARQIAA